MSDPVWKVPRVWARKLHYLDEGILGHKKLIFCFSGTGAFVFSPPLQKFYSKNRAHNFIKLNFVFKKSEAKNKSALETEDQFFNQVFNENRVIVMLKSAAGGLAGGRQLLVSAH